MCGARLPRPAPCPQAAAGKDSRRGMKTMRVPGKGKNSLLLVDTLDPSSFHSGHKTQKNIQEVNLNCLKTSKREGGNPKGAKSKIKTKHLFITQVRHTQHGRVEIVASTVSPPASRGSWHRQSPPRGLACCVYLCCLSTEDHIQPCTHIPLDVRCTAPIPSPLL